MKSYNSGNVAINPALKNALRQKTNYLNKSFLKVKFLKNNNPRNAPKVFNIISSTSNTPRLKIYWAVSIKRLKEKQYKMILRLENDGFARKINTEKGINIKILPDKFR